MCDQKCLIWVFFWLEFENNIVIFESSALELQNLVKNYKCLVFESKMPYLAIARLEFYKTTTLFEIGTLEFAKNGFLTHTVNFGIWSAFSKGLVSASSEGSGPGPGPLYKVFQNLRKS